MRTNHLPPLPQAQYTERVIGNSPLPPPLPQAQDTEPVIGDIPCVSGGRTDHPDEMNPMWATEIHKADVIAAGEDGISPRPPPTDEMDHEWTDLLDSLRRNEPVFEDDIMRDGIFGMVDDQRDDVDPLSFYPGSASLDNLPLGGGGDGS